MRVHAGLARELALLLKEALLATVVMTLKSIRTLTAARRVTILVHDDGATSYEREGWPEERFAR